MAAPEELIAETSATWTSSAMFGNVPAAVSELVEPVVLTSSERFTTTMFPLTATDTGGCVTIGAMSVKKRLAGGVGPPRGLFGPPPVLFCAKLEGGLVILSVSDGMIDVPPAF